MIGERLIFVLCNLWPFKKNLRVTNLGVLFHVSGSFLLCYTVTNANQWSPSPAGNPGMSLIKLFLVENTSGTQDFLESSAPDPGNPPPPPIKKPKVFLARKSLIIENLRIHGLWRGSLINILNSVERAKLLQLSQNVTVKSRLRITGRHKLLFQVEFGIDREYLMCYRVPGFLAVLGFGSVPLPSPLSSVITVSSRAGIFKEATGAWNRGGRGLSYRQARLHRLAEFIPWNRFRGPINV